MSELLSVREILLTVYITSFFLESSTLTLILSLCILRFWLSFLKCSTFLLSLIVFLIIYFTPLNVVKRQNILKLFPFSSFSTSAFFIDWMILFSFIMLLPFSYWIQISLWIILLVSYYWPHFHLLFHSFCTMPLLLTLYNFLYLLYTASPYCFVLLFDYYYFILSFYVSLFSFFPSFFLLDCLFFLFIFVFLTAKLT